MRTHEGSSMWGIGMKGRRRQGGLGNMMRAHMEGAEENSFILVLPSIVFITGNG